MVGNGSRAGIDDPARTTGSPGPILAARRALRLLGQLIRHVSRDQTGGIPLVVGLATPLLAGGAVLAVETAVWFGTKHQVQQIVDAAAMEGARALSTGQDIPTVQAKANHDAALEGYTAGGRAILTFKSPPSSGPNAGNKAAVEVVATRTLPTLLSGLLLGSGSRTATARAVALGKDVAGSTPGSAICMLALATTGEKAIFLSGSGSTVAHNCSMAAWSTDSRALYLHGSGSIGGHTAFLRGQDYISGSGRFAFAQPVSSSFAGTLDDPYAGLADPVLSGACTKTNFEHAGSGAIMLSPGRYCGGIKNRFSGTINLEPGTYYIDGGNVDNAGSGHIRCPSCGRGTGVTLVFTASSNPASNTGALVTGGSGSVILPAPGPGSGQPYVGIVVYMDRRATVATRTFGIEHNGSGTFQLSGAVYVPGREIKLNGSGTVNQTGMACAALIGQRITLNGSGTFQTGDCATMGTVLPRPRKTEVMVVE